MPFWWYVLKAVDVMLLEVKMPLNVVELSTGAGFDCDRDGPCFTVGQSFLMSQFHSSRTEQHFYYFVQNLDLVTCLLEIHDF